MSFYSIYQSYYCAMFEIDTPTFTSTNLKEMLAKYDIDSNSTKLFLQTHEIQDINKHFKYCMNDILF
ncbi:577_t:CDS:2 [Funneliformis caledonium]|uniref:577_t:CDS:1 n=1 Tax=Funneliformis caledonium TaxID=1117310 RepID=A0A9N9HPR1_9GLOM|nr:577_t:CDS:2 [Funneliformis caledonium]